MFPTQSEPEGGSKARCWDLNISMKSGERLSMEQVKAFLTASEELRFEAGNREEIYDWVTTTLVEHEYSSQKREAKGVLRSYILKMTGLSRAQGTRLIARYKASGVVRERSYRRNRYSHTYTVADIKLLAEVDEAHETLAGPATQKILYRGLHDYGEQQYERLAKLSSSHIYNLRKSRLYRETKICYEKTKATKVSIGERRSPTPEGRPGYLRIDNALSTLAPTVHQGDKDGVKGIYHINAVDEVTQWQVVGAAAHISEAWLIPVLEAMLEQFPFRILGFHSDNGSEFINHTVRKLLEKLLVEQTKSRPRRSTGNGLVECKNGAVIRKHIGYGHIASEHAEAMQDFYEQSFNPYLNLHRPCGVPEIVTDAKGKQRRIYRWYATPLEILQQLPDVAKYMNAGQTLAGLQHRAGKMSDTEAAKRMQKDKQLLFAAIQEKRTA